METPDIQFDEEDDQPEGTFVATFIFNMRTQRHRMYPPTRDNVNRGTLNPLVVALCIIM